VIQVKGLMGMKDVSMSSWTHKSLELERLDPICQEGVGAGDLSVSAVRSGPVRSLTDLQGPETGLAVLVRSLGRFRTGPI
jgi:hypothetical protein